MNSISSWWMLTNAQLWSSLPFSSIFVQNLNIAYVIAYYAVLSSGIYILTNKRLTIRLPSLHQGMGLALLALLALATWAVAIVLLLISS